MFVVRGYDGSYQDDVEVFDFSDASKPCENPTSYPQGVFEAVTFLIDDAPVVCGGYSTTHESDCYQYNSNSNTWDQVRNSLPDDEHQSKFNATFLPFSSLPCPKDGMNLLWQNWHQTRYG